MINNETKTDIGFDVRQSTVFYEQWYQIIKELPPKERDKAYKYIFEYAFYGIEPERAKTTSMSYVVFGMAKPNIDSAQKRYDVATENGQKGGRPKKVTEETREKIEKLRKNGMTQKQVATELGLSLKTIQRVEKDISQNHNENVNVNDNVNVNVNNVASNEGNTDSASPINNYSLLASKKKTYNDFSQKECDKIFAESESGKTEEELAIDYNTTIDVINKINASYLFN